jgi:hypothetical protein
MSGGNLPMAFLVRAQAEGSIVVVLPGGRSRLQAVMDWCRERPRAATAAAFVLVTLLSGLVIPPALPARADIAPGHADGAEGVRPPDADQGARLYPLAALPRPADGPVPEGKGMWIYLFSRANNGDPATIVNRAKAAGLTHVYLRLGSSKAGFYAQRDLDRLLPVAHAAGIKVVGWDFAYLGNPAADVERAKAEIWYATPTGHRIDAFSADIETPAEGTHLSSGAVSGYGAMLRQAMGRGYPLIATVPRPSPKRWFPYADLGAFDAVAPMVYWGNRDPAADAAAALADLSFLNKPVIPVGQAYDMAVDGGPKGAPSKLALNRFIESAAAHGAKGVSFWVWDTATADHWAAVSEAGQFNRP